MILTLHITGPVHKPDIDRFQWGVTCPETNYRAYGNATTLEEAERMIASAATCVVDEALR